MTEIPLVYDLGLEQIADIFLRTGEPAYRADQIWEFLYHQFNDDPASYTNLPKNLREEISTDFQFTSLSKITASFSKDNNTHKVLFRTAAGDKIETVLMRYERRRTVCISTQSGCGIGCVFCATGQMGFERNLSSGEIIEQVLYFARLLKDDGDSLTNIVIMGMGEPFQNYDATMKAVETLNHPKGFNFGARRITISTVGLVPMIEQFTQESRQVNLAVSLHAATNELRDKLVPINRKYPIEMLIESCRKYVSQTRRRITFEWAMIAGVNDDLAQAKALANQVDGLLCHVNLIPLNPTNGYSESATTVDVLTEFQDYLLNRGISCTTRLRRGIEIQAGCGQLAGELL